MSHAMVTVIAPLARERLTETQALIDAMGNPASAAIASALEPPDGENGTHFMSLHAIPSGDGQGAWVALELSADGTEDEALNRLTAAIGPQLIAVFSLASDWGSRQDLRGYLNRRRVVIGGGLMDNPGIAFDGTPGLSVGRIRRAASLSARCAALLAEQPGGLSGRARLEHIREKLRDEAGLGWAFEPPPVPPPYSKPGLGALLPGMLASAVATYLWPLGLLLLAVAVIAGVFSRHHHVGAFVHALWIGVLISIPLVLAGALLIYVKLRAQEDSDSLEERTIAPDVLDAILARENRAAHNHMLSITRRKPGWVRWFTHRLVFWLVGQLAAKSYRPGFLSDIGTIHFARWVTVPGSRDFLFFSNYGGSWESYLEDFITRAHAGLTAVWSNAIGFPRSTNLIEGGATDGERFKRYARQSMVPTRFWFSAYPALTTSNIRANSEIHLGFAAAMTEDECRQWLALFGSAARPDEKLVSSEIQSLVFGGLKFLPFGEVRLHALPGDVAGARAWLAGVFPHVAFNDGRRLGENAVVTLALSAGGFARLGLPREGLETFPAAFLEGMASPGRSQVLGDTGSQAPEHWQWGREPPDAALLLYAESEESLAEKRAALEQLAAAHGATVVRSIPLREVTDDKREPFGFVDGVSQPAIRGTYKGLRAPDPIHLVEAGEFVLGYPDNRKNLPPGPTLPATLDPENALPLVARAADLTTTRVESPRDLGANGTFLVIRQLEQDVEGFWRYCEAEAGRLSNRLGPPYTVNAEFIAAKMVGRWTDGSSLVRNSYDPASRLRHHSSAMARPKPASKDAATPVDPPQQTTTYNDNDFLFGTEDPEALRCPFGAHIRRANPRDSLDPGSAEQIAITNRHRILRVGRQYVPEDGRDPGLMFMCLNGDLERQFEFVQQTWLNSPSFHGLSCEKDGVMGDAAPGECGFTIPTRDGPVSLSPVPRFVTMLGGGYFFMPGRRLIAYLAA